MRLINPTRRAALVSAAVTGAVGAAVALGALGGPAAAAGTPHAASASSSADPSVDPVVTPLAAALVPGRIDIESRRPSNVVTVRIDFPAGATTGWHSHPGPVLVQVVSGAVTLRHAAHGRCVSEVVRAGHGFFEARGAVHVAENSRPDPAVVFATFVLPPTAGPEVSAPIPVPCR